MLHTVALFQCVYSHNNLLYMFMQFIEFTVCRHIHDPFSVSVFSFILYIS